MNDTIAPDDESLQRPRPISADRAHAVGLITLHWNLCETELRSILIKYAGMDAQTGALFTLDMGFEGVKKRLSHFASQHERDPAVADRLRLGIEIADVCRRNRNIIAHSWINLAGTKLFHERMRDQPVTKVYRFDIEELRRVADELWDCGMFLLFLGLYLAARGDPNWRQELPQRIAVPKEIQPTDQFYPRELEP